MKVSFGFSWGSVNLFSSLVSCSVLDFTMNYGPFLVSILSSSFVLYEYFCVCFMCPFLLTDDWIRYFSTFSRVRWGNVLKNYF